jgi:hypothetical protein
MTYVSWAVLFEGASDAAYFGILLPRVMDDLVLSRGTRNSIIPTAPAIVLRRGSVENVAAEACAAEGAFHLVFIHADTGGRAQAEAIGRRSISYCQAMHDLCGLPSMRCITIEPRHETEAWLLCDPGAVMGALGYRGRASDAGLPENAREAEALVDPKATLKSAMRVIRGRRREEYPETLYPAIAQRQNLNLLRTADSFAAFERRLSDGLQAIGCW